DGSGVNDIGVIDRAGQDGAEGLAYDESRDVLYGAINGNFYTINQATAVASANLATPTAGADVEGIAWDGADTIYGLVGFAGPNRGDLLAYNILANTWSFLFDTGIDFNLPGLAYDISAGVLYAIGSQDPNLYRIDPGLGTTTLVGDTGLSPTGGGLAFVIPEPSTLTLAAFGFIAAEAELARLGIA
ncbi:MAG: hypothetical protein IH991_03130, partial [Planctomycetes bacterium]|nr:hypothetical protein [Planctomycetota bacterium]